MLLQIFLDGFGTGFHVRMGNQIGVEVYRVAGKGDLTLLYMFGVLITNCYILQSD